MKTKIHITINYKTKDLRVNVTIDFTQIRIKLESQTVAVVNKVQSITNLLPASKR